MTDSKKEMDKRRIVFHQIEQLLETKNIKILSKDENRPWGGYFVINPDYLDSFIEHFFADASKSQLDINLPLSPKILMVKPHQRLSWQYHHRRSEIWTVSEGEVGVITSETDKPGELRVLTKGDLIQLGQGERHRLVGLDQWAVVAEIWQHTDPENPSDEEDIVRLQDDYGR